MTYYTYRFRLYPNKEQKIAIAKTFGCVRFVHNCMLETKISYYREHCKNIRVTPAEYKEKYPFLKEVDSLALANEQLMLEASFSYFFRNPKKIGFPKFKIKRHRQSYTTSNQNNKVRIKNHHIKLPKIGMVKLKDHRTVDGEIKRATVVKEPDGKYYVSILTEREILQLPSCDNKIGLDMGIKYLVVTSDGVKLKNLDTLRKFEKKLSKEQRRLSRKEKNSNNWGKQRVKVARCHSKITNVRKDYINRITHKLISENQTIATEDLDVRRMMMEGNSALSKRIADASWCELIRQLEYKSQWYGRSFVKVNRFYPSSLTCSACGFVNTDVKSLAIRQWKCPICGKNHDRDINAAENILSKALELLHNTNLGQILSEVTPVESE